MNTKTLKDYGLNETTLIQFRVPVYHGPNSIGIYRADQVLKAKDVTLEALSFEKCWRVIKDTKATPQPGRLHTQDEKGSVEGQISEIFDSENTATPKTEKSKKNSRRKNSLESKDIEKMSDSKE